MNINPNKELERIEKEKKKKSGYIKGFKALKNIFKSINSLKISNEQKNSLKNKYVDKFIERMVKIKSLPKKYLKLEE